ncbi:Formylglycine-generating enzyme, required for sulfatase activity, contains SUMF1/FGE domain [Thiothrix eikelboomii]|uniref:Formylglycine-generating enzyme, required for sulfatase activity, contains SUMF1/FGE domain n=1 Tax=Thiothrix eikelboomii TaxID=92487 RepID=A0A1T4X5A8_9GAMM|nr:SUMF1/EgtB/PvdO family nonheme iron enzyme [Thiothrix eikelboomii]SKA84772.1 Formylglycine-generating enzyme, required for sulfatase activity, contains SUMF1/FGE domain [Thiothrix eikelboomii]
MMHKPPRVFISYSHDSEAHRELVLGLANRLRNGGVESWIDQYIPSFPVQGWLRWMKTEVEQADFVLLVCTPRYLQRFNGEDTEGGRGVNFEGVIISQTLYNHYYRNTKFIPVLPPQGCFEHLPLELQAYSAYKLDTDYQDLYRLLTGQPKVTPPPVGQVVQLPEKTHPSFLPSLSIESAYLQSLLQQSQLRFADKTYTTLSGQFQPDRSLIPPECLMSASLLFEAYRPSHAVRDCPSPSEQQDDLLAAFAKYQRLVLLGEPGTGKTFSLWRIATEQARKTLANPTEPLPVIIPLNRWTDAEQSLASFVLEQMGSLASHFTQLCQAGRVLPLLDALNELPFDQRAHKLPQVRAFVNQVTRLNQPAFKRLLLTCRHRDYVDALEQDLDRLTIEPLDPPRIWRFLQNYFHYFAEQQPQRFATKLAERLFWQLAGGEKVQACWQDWQQQGKTDQWQAFWQLRKIPDDWPDELKYSWNNYARQAQLADPRSLLKLAANPYLLFLITTLYARYQELPQSRIELFGRFVEVLLKRESAEKASSRAYVPERMVLLTALKQLAWQLQSRSGAAQEARTVLARHEAVQTMPAADLEFAAAASLLELTRDSVRFSHQLLQEFFTAQGFKDRREQGFTAAELWPPDQWWQPNGWEEAAKLAAEYEAEPQALLEWLVPAQPLLAYEIAEQFNSLDPALFAPFRANWQVAITDLENYPNPHERHAFSTLLGRFAWDQRFGIGLDAQGLPEIDWLEISAGEFIYQAGERSNLPSFKISRYLITNAQFRAFVQAAEGYADPRWWQGLNQPKTAQQSSWQESNRPMEQVDWYEALAFCRWLSAKTGLTISLPTEQQWEKAARGTEGHEYPWGNEFKSEYCNGEYSLVETSAVGIYPQEQALSGAMDMAGNVWEWCLNKYNLSNMTEPDLSGDWRVWRGGSWHITSENLRCAVRFGALPTLRLYDLGFRVCAFSLAAAC